MQHLYAREYLEEGDSFIVSCEYSCNVRVMDDSNYRIYNTSGRYHFYGGHYRRLPARIAVPSSGYWTAVIDFGGRWPTSRFRYGFQTLKHT